VKVALVSGTSSGIGLETALLLARNGFLVFAGLRNVAKAEPLLAAARAESLPLEILELDVTQPESVSLAVETALGASGGIEALVNNAGIGGAAPLEEVPEAEHRAMFETNYWGAISLCRAVLPWMRERKSGAIVNVTSITGRVPIPNQIPYSASKHALEAASEALAAEVRAFGVRVAIVEPGVIDTAIFTNSEPATHYDRTSPYRHVMRRNGRFYASLRRKPTHPRRVAETILEAITTDHPRLRWRVGEDAEKLIDGRARMSDEEWIDFGLDLPDPEYAARWKRAFGFEV
jgi:NAD(P)-dependent dehydrogenase (short-subunit alcohol dehydrogenase family)